MKKTVLIALLLFFIGQTVPILALRVQPSCDQHTVMIVASRSQNVSSPANNSELNSFWGTLLGSFLPAAVAVGVFWGTIYLQKKERNKVLKTSLEAISALCGQAIVYMGECETMLKKLCEELNDDNVDLVRKVPYALHRISNYDMNRFTETFAKYGVTDPFKRLTDADHLCCLMDDLNNSFEKAMAGMDFDKQAVEAKINNVLKQIQYYKPELEKFKSEIGKALNNEEKTQKNT